MKKLKYSLNKNGIVDGIGFNSVFEFTVNENTPFKTISESFNYRLINDVWEWYDYTWTHPEFAVRVTIPETIILDSLFYRSLADTVLDLIKSGFAQQETINNSRVMYFNQLQAEHRKELEQDSNVIINEKNKIL